MIFLSSSVIGTPNPSAVYCDKMGYTYKTDETPEGERGVCVVKPGVEFEAEDFFKGKVGKEYSYCAKEGYNTEAEIDEGEYSTEYAVCVSRKTFLDNIKSFFGIRVEEVRTPMHELMGREGESLIGTESIKQNEKKTIILNKVKIDKKILEQAQQSPDEFQRVIIIFDKKPKGYRNFINSLGGRVTHDYDIIEGTAISLPGRVIERLTELKNLVSIQEDRIVHAFLSESVPLINADDVWSGYNGSGKTVCVVDTGIDYNHPALSGKVVAQKCYCCEQYNPQGCVRGCCPNGGEIEDNAMDDNGHGTHCAGIIASNNETYKGVAPGASLMAVKVLDSSGSGWESEVIAGIDWCSNQSADVISISLGGGLFSTYCDSEADAQAVNNAVDAGAVVSIASGNDGSTTQISAPACASKAISVGDVYDADVGGVGWSGCTDSTTHADKIVCHSNRNNILDLLAPGALIMSTVLNNGFDEYGGTSMAAPHVSGAAALLLEANSSLTPTEVENILKITGVDITDTGGSELTFPRIDVLAAVSLPQIGHLEPYLIDPISDKNVTQNEFFNFSSGVKCVGGDCGNVSATLDPETEIFYDDGIPDVFSDSAKYLGWGNPGGGFAVRFTSPSYPIKIKTARFYVSDTTPFELHVWSDNNMPGSDLITPFQVNPDISESWYDIDLSSYNIEITSGDFYIGWIELSATNYVGTDTTPPHDDRSWVYDGSSWALLSSYGAPYDNIDMMIRAVVETGKGAIPMNSGTPFYTISPNPQNSSNLACLQNMQTGDSCNQTWTINATGEINTSWEFFTIYDSITYDMYIETNKTERVNITIVSLVNNPPTAVALGPSTGMVDVPLQFDGSQSYDPDNDTLTYYWQFGDTNYATTVKPIHTYSIQGMYPVNLTVTDYYGLYDDDILTVNILPADSPQGGGVTLEVNVTS